ncbi:MAG: phosphoribosylformylglycinamidine cyclo-ligase [Pseudomonadota bacterium]
MSNNAYKQAGVDIEAGNTLVEKIKPAIKKTNRAGVMSNIGGFGAFFDPKAAGYEDPILVSATDGVGTKLKVAIDTQKYDTAGIDLVAMCVNDLIVQGAEPLFFLDYYACGHLNTDDAQSVIEGIAKGCEIAGCALIGGETAEMPGMYDAEDFDLAGFSVGAVERNHIINGETIEEGDVILGLASSGLHSNGFSLIRKILNNTQGHSYDSPSPFSKNQTLGEYLLTPTKIYVQSLLEVMKTHPNKIKGLAHITGGGLLENIPRIMPGHLAAEIHTSQWVLPQVFRWLKEAGKLSNHDLSLTLNCGIGMVLICSDGDSAAIKGILENNDEIVFEIGKITNKQDEESVFFHELDHNWN